jgi:hypothetical protein
MLVALKKKELCLGESERIVICYYYKWYNAQIHLLLRVCCVILQALGT